MQSRLTILLMADMVDYSRLMEHDQPAALKAIGELKSDQLEPVVVANGGEILKRMGDGWIFAFTSVGTAINCAMSIQDKLSVHPKIKLRMGAHIGEIVEDEDDFYGPGVNLAQRIQTEAPPGGLMISQDLYRQLPSQLASDFKDAGSFKLKNIALPLNLFHWRPLKSKTTGADDVPSIMIEQFAFAPDDADTQAVVADLRDQLLGRLSKRTGVRVLDDASSPTIDATYKLRGRLRQAGHQGRLSLSLVIRSDGTAVWSQTYNGDTSDIFRFCDDLLDRAEADLRLQINAFDGERVSHLSDEELSISELRSRAASTFYKPTNENWNYARRLLERALLLNPNDPMALAMRAEAVVMLSLSRFETLPDEQSRELQSQLSEAITVLPRSDYVFCVCAVLQAHVFRDAASAEDYARRALVLSPAYVPGHEMLGLGQLLAGKLDDAADSLQKSVLLGETDPLVTYRMYLLAISELCRQNSEAALNTINRAIQLQPSQRLYHVIKSEAYRQMGKEKLAIEARRLADALPREPSILAPKPPLPDDHAELVSLLRVELQP